eukprot:jgi/Galph1/751/GphlegSOOS_G5538.1
MFQETIETFFVITVLCVSETKFFTELVPVEERRESQDFFDLVILSNGPGELNTWVKPVVNKLRTVQNDYLPSCIRLRISIVLSPCVHSNGKELEIACNMTQVDRVLSPKHWFSFLIFGNTGKSKWTWYSKGIVLYLGGDQFFAGWIARRLHFKSVAYVEWKSRWPGWIDYYVFARRTKEQMSDHAVIGDLTADAPSALLTSLNDGQVEKRFGSNPMLIALLPGSKNMKLVSLVPFLFAVCDIVHSFRKDCRFVLPVAPGVSIETLARYACSLTNPILSLVGGTEAVYNGEENCFITTSGTRIDVWERAPAYDVLSRCKVALTCVGANTAELAGMGLPTFVVVPTQQLDAMRAWDGLLGILCHLPILGRIFAFIINWIVIRLYQSRKFGYLALPNKWANRLVMPEYVGRIHPKDVAIPVAACLSTPGVLSRMRRELLQVCEPFGAVSKLASFYGIYC